MAKTAEEAFLKNWRVHLKSRAVQWDKERKEEERLYAVTEEHVISGNLTVAYTTAKQIPSSSSRGRALALVARAYAVDSDVQRACEIMKEIASPDERSLVSDLVTKVIAEIM